MMIEMLKSKIHRATVTGAAARLVHRGDRIIICAYAQLDEREAEVFQPKIVLVDEINAITKRFG